MVMMIDFPAWVTATPCKRQTQSRVVAPDTEYVPFQAITRHGAVRVVLDVTPGPTYTAFTAEGKAFPTHDREYALTTQAMRTKRVGNIE